MKTRYQLRKEEDRRQKQKNKVETTQALHEAMLSFWFYSDRRCECCGRRLPNEFLTTTVHHLLPKGVYDDVQFEEQYWMLLHPDCHTAWEVSHDNKKVEERTRRAEEEYDRQRVLS